MATSHSMVDSPAHHEFSGPDSVTELLSNHSSRDRERWNSAELVPESVRVKHAARHESNVAASVRFTDAMLSHPLLLQSLSSRDIVSLKCVCKPWAAWFPHNITTIANARRQDDSRDWYFPVIAELDHLRTPASLWLFGIWHASADQSSQKLLRASPVLDYLPSPPPHCRHLQYDIMASSQGLLLVKALSVSLMAPDHKRCKLNPRKACKCSSCYEGFGLRRKWEWEYLTVINPLTKQYRVLPTIAQGWTAKHYQGAKAQIVVDDEANSYKVLFYKCRWSSMFVYESETDSWHRVNHSLNPGSLRPELGTYNCSSVEVRGRLYFADIREATVTERQRNATVCGVLRLFEIDIGTGWWTPADDLPLCKWPDLRIQNLGITPFFDFERNVARNLELVECLGRLFAVIPARLDEILEPLQSVRPRLWSPDPSALDFEQVMALQFYIFPLEGAEDLHCGVLRIEIPRDSKTCKHKRQKSLYEKTTREPADSMDPGPNWFSCTAKGSVIWVSFEDYLLQYDVESGQSKTQLLPKLRMQRCDQQMRFAYRASFHMKP